MNSKFYEFWGNFFTTVAQGQKQLEDMTAWMKQGFTGAGDLNELFRRCYGLTPSTADGTQDSQRWLSAVSDFQQSLAQLAAQWGWVSQTEHQKVLDKCSALETQVQRQQETIKKLRDMLDPECNGHSELFQHLQGALREQGDQFHALMQSIHDAYEDESKK